MSPFSKLFFFTFFFIYFKNQWKNAFRKPLPSCQKIIQSRSCEETKAHGSNPRHLTNTTISHALQRARDGRLILLKFSRSLMAQSTFPSAKRLSVHLSGVVLTLLLLPRIHDRIAAYSSSITVMQSYSLSTLSFLLPRHRLSLSSPFRFPSDSRRFRSCSLKVFAPV